MSRDRTNSIIQRIKERSILGRSMQCEQLSLHRVENGVSTTSSIDSELTQQNWLAINNMQEKVYKVLKFK